MTNRYRQYFIRKFSKILVKSLTVLSIVIGSFMLIQGSVKVIQTGFELMAIHGKIQFYNECARKTDAMTEEYLEDEAVRQAIYASEDVVIRVYSNQPTVLKILGLLLAPILILSIGVMWLYYLLKLICYLQKNMGVESIKKKVRREIRIYKRYNQTDL